MTRVHSASKNWELHLKSAKKAAEIGGEILIRYFGRLPKVEVKEKAGLVSQADVESEEAILNFLKVHHPDIGFLAEESSFRGEELFHSQKHKGRWIIDPLDGTTNYVHGFPIFCVSIGLEWEGQIVLGFIYAPMLQQTFSAIRGGGAFLNGTSIAVSSRASLEDSLIATGFSSHQLDGERELQLNRFLQFIGKTRGIRRAGAAAYDLCMVAQGVFDAFFEENLSPWDTAAGQLIVEEAGGKVTTYEGEPFTPYKSSILATNTVIHENMLSALSV